jgi:hypothetical protein
MMEIYVLHKGRFAHTMVLRVENVVSIACGAIVRGLATHKAWILTGYNIRMLYLARSL